MEDLVKLISQNKEEPTWMTDFRLEALAISKNLPSVVDLDLEKINFYQKPQTKISCIPKHLQNILAGYEMQHDSEAVYGSIIKKIADQGVLFTDTDSAFKKYPEIFKKYFGQLVLPNDNKYAALNSAFWSGGSFVFVPKNVKVLLPLQAFFKINSKNLGQFERTLIIAEEGSEVTYLEGCSAQVFSQSALHAGVVEIFVGKNAKVKYITTQNWSTDIYNLVTKRSKIEVGGQMRWLDINIGSKVTMKYPSCYLVGDGARGEMISLSVANAGQIQDTGAKMYHLAPNTTSQIISKSVSLNGGKNIFRGTVKANFKSVAKMRCDSLILDKKSMAQSIPVINAQTNEAQISHEATISKIEEDQLFYLQNRGLSKEEAESLIVNGFTQPIIKLLPMEYAVELNHLIQLEMHEAVG